MFPFDKSHNDLVFENKNKMYGAYVIRREYDYVLKISILVATGFLGLIVTLGVIASSKNGASIVCKLPPLEDVFEFNFEHKQPEEKPLEKKIERHTTTTTPPPAGEIKATDDVLENKPEQKIEPATTNSNLPVGDTASAHPGDTEAGIGVETTKKVEPPPVLIAPVMPNIEGGILPYVRSHIRYPAEAVEIHAQGTVHISFVVEKDGSISNVNVLNKEKVGYGCEEEAIRVIKSGKWSPGSNNGQPVRVQLTLPVKYQLQ